MFVRALLTTLLLVLCVQSHARDRVGNGALGFQASEDQIPGDKTGNGMPLAPGDRVGNGGYGVKCLMSGSQFEVEALDVFELRSFGKTPVQVSVAFGFENVILQLGDVLFSAMETQLATDLRNEVMMLSRAIRGERAARVLQAPHEQDGPGKYVEIPILKLVTDRPVLPKLDTGLSMPVPFGCQKVGVIAQYRREEAIGQNSFYELDHMLWNQMDEVSQAALILHEVLFREVLRKDPNATSEQVRDLVGIALTEEGQVTPRKQIQKMLKRAGLR